MRLHLEAAELVVVGTLRELLKDCYKTAFEVFILIRSAIAGQMPLKAE
jgi:hypothetical protein